MNAFDNCLQQNCSTPPDDDYSYLRKIYDVFADYVWMVPVVFGVPGNVISAFVATRKHNRDVSTCVYMVALAITDTLLLLQLVWYYPIVAWNLGKDITESRDLIFKFQWYVNFTFGMSSGGFLAVMAVDRLIAIRYPLMARTLCTVKRAKRTVVAIFIIIAILNLNTFYTFRYIKDSATGLEVIYISVPEYPIIELLASGFHLIIGTIFPFVIIAISNLVIIITVKQASKERLGKSTSAFEDRQKREHAYLTRMLIFVCAAYIVCSIPLRLYYLYLDIPQFGSQYVMSDTYWNYRYNIELIFLFEFWTLNYSINFYVYCLGGGKRYREDSKAVLKEFLNCVICRKA